jgi:TonB family protein
LAGTGTRVDIQSQLIGPGGAAQMSYDLAVAKIFEREFQRRPVTHRGNEPSVEVEVVVRRDGSVTGRIVKKSGRAQLDRTEQQVLDSTRKVIPFPEHCKSETRTNRINFNLDDTKNG